ncbi:unnamed protein product [Staurois parvus]|uniref:Uncharacterized protein n=1 Tax=Staurois parvus TaxID=386267 RepID=A0ABN9GWB0_9NEOB|nr:unnamed protein product [Staurois parvus]
MRWKSGSLQALHGSIFGDMNRVNTRGRLTTHGAPGQ